VENAIETDRLVLCPVTMDDRAAVLAHWAAPDVRRFLFDGAMLSAAEVAEAITDSVRDFTAAGYGFWIIREPDGPGLIGTAGLRPLDDVGLEIFYSLAPGSWGKGYATEAAGAVVEYALGPLGLPEVLAEIDEGNAASVAVVKRLGMTPYEVVPGVLGPMTRYRRTAKLEGPPAVRVRAAGQRGARIVRLPREDESAEVKVLHGVVRTAHHTELLAEVIAVQAGPGTVGLGPETGSAAPSGDRR
jgi:[ribosomal protein S5]-alanine N-acetyltransferase